MTDVVIVGAGLIGMLCARELSEAGANVRVLERGASGRESSWAGGGILSPLYPWRYPDPVSELAAWGQPLFAELAAALATESGVDPEYRRSGLLMLDTAEADAAHAWARRFGAELQDLAPEQTLECEPALAQSAASLWMPQVAQMRNPRLAKALRGSILARGVRLDEHTEVMGIRHANGRLTGVDTRDGPLDADRVVVAGGAWTGSLLESTGIHLPIEPVRGQMLLFRGPPGLLSRIVLAGGHYAIPRADGHVVFGSTMERVGFDKTTTEEARQLLLERVRALLPAVGALPLQAHWSGLRPGSPTGVPLIGSHPRIEGLFVNAGHFRNGVVLSYASARLLADLLLERPVQVAPEAYNPKNFIG